MTTRLHDALQRVGVAIDHPAVSAALTRRAFLDESANTEGATHQVLEFVGDAVLDLVVSDELARRFPDAVEGQLTEARKQLVENKRLVRIGRALELEAHVRMGAGEAKQDQVSGGKALADHVEALIGAVYRIRGLEGAVSFVTALLDDAWPTELADATLDPKSRLNLFCQGRFKQGCGKDAYEVERRGLDHDPEYRAKVTLPDGETFHGEWRKNKTDAQRAAAQAALDAVAPTDD